MLWIICKNWPRYCLTKAVPAAAGFSGIRIINLKARFVLPWLQDTYQMVSEYTIVFFSDFTRQVRKMLLPDTVALSIGRITDWGAFCFFRLLVFGSV